MFKKIFFIITIFIFTLIIFILGINVDIIVKSSKYIIEPNSLSNYKADCILILGASVYKNGDPSPMLKDRLDMGIYLYNNTKTKKLLMSGDHRVDSYDEVGIMKNYATQNDIISSDIFKDHKGIDTYQSLYRAKYVYGVKNIIIVTQRYHMYRAIYIANNLGLNVVGVNAEVNNYHNQISREIREIFARLKAFFNTNIKKEKNHIGISYDIKGNGDITN